MMSCMPTTFRPQQRDEDRLRDLRIATERVVPRLAARGWLAAAPTVVVGLDVVNLTEPELRQEALKLRCRVRKIAAWSGSRSPCSTTPASGSQESICQTGVPRLGSTQRWTRPAYTPLQGVRRFLQVSPRRLQVWVNGSAGKHAR